MQRQLAIKFTISLWRMLFTDVMTQDDDHDKSVAL